MKNNIPETYKEIIDVYVKNSKEKNMVNDIFLLRPTLKLDLSILFEILQKVSEEYDIPFRDIKCIGSAHVGFSFVKPKDSKDIKYFDKDSDLDIAIINRKFFYTLYKLTVKTTNYFRYNTEFKTQAALEQFKGNILKGYIRPDTIGNKKFRLNWNNFFYELSKEYNIKISAAIYLDEDTLTNKIQESLNYYKKKLEE